MSLFASLTTAVGGLTAQSDAMGNISDNLANTQTTGFKGVDTSFQAMVTRSNSNLNNPGGVRALPRYQNGLSGSIAQSTESTNLAISGAGFFVVRAATTGGSNGTTTFDANPLYTRAGDFSLDKSGYLVNASGYYLCGYNVDTAGNVDTSAANPIQIADLLDNPVASSQVTYAGNLPSSQAVGTTNPPSTLQLYDNLGTTRSLSFTWTKTAVGAWDLAISVPGGGVAGADYTATIPFTFNTVVAPGVPVGSLASIGAGALWTVVPHPGATDPAQISVNLSFLGSGAQTVVMDFGNYNSTNGVTQFSTDVLATTTFEQNGIPRGAFKNLSIDKSGYVALNYDNGRTRIVSQVPVAQFFAQGQLDRVSGGAFVQTLTSGTARLEGPGTYGTGTILGNSLEGSNVDLAAEFTKMIQAQRIYSANAKTITTADQMMQDILNVIR